MILDNWLTYVHVLLVAVTPELFLQLVHDWDCLQMEKGEFVFLSITRFVGVSRCFAH